MRSNSRKRSNVSNASNFDVVGTRKEGSLTYEVKSRQLFKKKETQTKKETKEIRKTTKQGTRQVSSRVNLAAWCNSINKCINDNANANAKASANAKAKAKCQMPIDQSMMADAGQMAIIVNGLNELSFLLLV